jgi:MFS family permease
MDNKKRLLWAGFMAILAAGVGMSIRGGILGDWKGEFGFTDGQLGDLNGAGFTGFCFGIIIGGVIADKIGYGKLVIAAFLLHVLSAFVTFAAIKGMDQGTAYKLIYWGTWIFALANGTLEAVANPLVATLYPQNRTHYLNILHASWPLGLMIGSVLGAVLGSAMHLHWKLQLGMFLVPTAVYGLMFLGQKMPKSEASEKGLSLGDMFKDVGIAGGLVACFLLALFFGGVFKGFMSKEAATTASALGYAVGGILLVAVGIITRFSVGSILLFVLFIAHALVGAVELGTDGWIQNITGNLLTGFQGKMLFFWTSSVMFGLRFCAHFIEKKLGLSPVGILLVCAILACVGLLLSSGVSTFGVALLALGVYALGKTFFWPTMLAVASDRFPRTGAIAISFMGGIGMMSAGLIGSAGLGYAKDRFASEELQQIDKAAYETVKAPNPSKFLVFEEVTGFDGKKVDEVKKRLDGAREESAKAGKDDLESALQKMSPADRHVIEAGIAGDRKTLKADSAIPAMMALIYLGILLYFKTIGGYKAVTIDAGPAPEPKPTA